MMNTNHAVLYAEHGENTFELTMSFSLATDNKRMITLTYKHC